MSLYNSTEKKNSIYALSHCVLYCPAMCSVHCMNVHVITEMLNGYIISHKQEKSQLSYCLYNNVECPLSLAIDCGLSFLEHLH